MLTKLYGGHGPVYLNVSLSKWEAISLMRRSKACSWSRCTRKAAFDSKVEAIASQFDKLTFKYTGPWPPYNFVNIRLKLERAAEAE